MFTFDESFWSHDGYEDDGTGYLRPKRGSRYVETGPRHSKQAELRTSSGSSTLLASACWTMRGTAIIAASLPMGRQAG